MAQKASLPSERLRLTRLFWRLLVGVNMSDWDADDKPKNIANTWDDEEEVPDAWDADEKPKGAKPELSAPPKMSVKAKIAAKTEKKNKMIAELQKKQRDDEAKQLSELEREELSKQQECNLIMDSFGVSDAVPGQAAELDFSKVSTKQDFIDLSSKLVEKFKRLETSPHYSNFAEGFIRQISLQMDLDNLKELSLSINALVTEKQKLTKSKTKKKGVRTKLVVERSMNDYDYDDGNDDDYDDFL
ncbi:eukaryotic translation initiation factor 3 subunit j [Echinococcus multilocularis]|uniref:Eukaryotic translation initiation factor 3 subunit j n=1 Tax=Echinococcus multilocularis TaxID=6211 RepID=A0A068YAS3_ECHMU|nr:eukaryotic translation initiation factor 3 subunit j [Echinococcus multilocularis]